MVSMLSAAHPLGSEDSGRSKRWPCCDAGRGQLGLDAPLGVGWQTLPEGRATVAGMASSLLRERGGLGL